MVIFGVKLNKPSIQELFICLGFGLVIAAVFSVLDLYFGSGHINIGRTVTAFGAGALGSLLSVCGLNAVQRPVLTIAAIAIIIGAGELFRAAFL